MILFLGPLPEPTTGHSLACRVLLDALEQREPVTVVDLKKSDFRQGASSFRRVAEVLGMVGRIAVRQRRAEVIYFTISESVAGNLKDLLIYAVCWFRLPCMVIHLHGGAGMQDIMRRRGALLPALNRFFLRRLGGVIVLGARHRPIYQSIVRPERLHEVANFSEDALFVPDTAIASRFSSGGPLRLLFLSNLLPGKGHDELIYALASLTPEERSQIRLDVAGGFETETDRQDFCRRIAAYPEIIYHGTVRGADKADLFARAHLFCLPTYYPYEGQPISILEAYASGCCVLTTDHSGIFDTFTDGENGFAVEKRSSAAIAGVLRRALKDREALKIMGLRNAALARDRFTVRNYNQRVIGIIDKVRDECRAKIGS